MSSRLQRFAILLGFWLACLYVDEHDATLPAKIRHESHRQLITVSLELLSEEDTLSSMYFGIHLLQALVLQITSIVKRAYCTEVLLGEDTKDSSVANEVRESPISVNQSQHSEGARFSPFPHWSSSEI